MSGNKLSFSGTKMSYNWIQRDGFQFSGLFLCYEGVELMSGSDLRERFLPKITRGGQALLRRSSGFVKAQLRMYDIAYDDKEFTGQGTRLLQKVLQDGKCDRLPDHIATLREEMYIEWLKQLPHDVLSRSPEHIKDVYFRTAGKTDRSKCPNGVVIKFGRKLFEDAEKVAAIADEIDGLHQVTVEGYYGHRVFLGWDAEATEQAAKEHMAQEAEQVKAKDIEHESNEDYRHSMEYFNYLEDRKEMEGPEKYSPIGTYQLDCREFTEIYYSRVRTMSISDASDGILEASFNLGAVRGIMMLGRDAKALDKYIEELEHEGNDPDEDEEADGDESNEEDDANKDVSDDGMPKKRKAAPSSSQSRDHPSKKAKNTATDDLKYEIRIRGLDKRLPWSPTLLSAEAVTGSITFADNDKIKFTGVANFKFSPNDVHFTGRRISDDVDLGIDVWDDYSRSKYEAEQASKAEQASEDDDSS